MSIRIKCKTHTVVEIDVFAHQKFRSQQANFRVQALVGPAHGFLSCLQPVRTPHANPLAVQRWVSLHRFRGQVDYVLD